MRITCRFALLSLFALPALVGAQIPWDGVSNSPNGGNPIQPPPWGVIALGGDVQATIMPVEFNGNPGYNNFMYESTRFGGNVMSIGYEKTNLGTTVDLGSFSAGTEIIFAMLNPIGQTFYTGSAYLANTIDGDIHADVYNQGGGSRVDFEDVPFNQGSDGNYGDASLFVSNTMAMAVPEPAPLAVLGLGALGILVRRRRRQ
jgi:hypothetical protein